MTTPVTELTSVQDLKRWFLARLSTQTPVRVKVDIADRGKADELILDGIVKSVELGRMGAAEITLKSTMHDGTVTFPLVALRGHWDVD